MCVKCRDGCSSRSTITISHQSLDKRHITLSDPLYLIPTQWHPRCFTVLYFQSLTDTVMAERRCIIERGEKFFDAEKLVPSPQLAKHLAVVGADIWVPNPNKRSSFPLPAHKLRSKKEQVRKDLYPVWGTILLNYY
jgi:hypothetical protein